MKIVRIKDIEGTERDVQFTGGNSLRLLLEKDKMGYSFHETRIKKGIWHWHYKHHLESCFCVSGGGWIHNLDDGNSYEIKEGTMYVLDNHDNHEFEAKTETVLISVFNPPIEGSESHDKDGNYMKSEKFDTLINDIVREVLNSMTFIEAREKVESLILNKK